MNGLRVLIDDKSCIEMADSIVEGGVAEIYVEDPDIIELPNDDLQHDGQNSSRKVSSITESREKIERQIQFVREWYSPSKAGVAKRFGESSIQPSVAQNTIGRGSGDEKHSDAMIHRYFAKLMYRYRIQYRIPVLHGYSRIHIP